MTIKFERKSLYEEVWTTPLTKLARSMASQTMASGKSAKL